MWLLVIWGTFITVMSLGALGKGLLNTPHYILWSLVMLYITYIFKQL
jgi:hypothetical protein